MNCEEAAKLMDGYLDGARSRSPAEQSNNTCWSALNVTRLTKSMARLFVRLATQVLISRRLRNYVSEFNRRCETRSPNFPRALFRESLSRCSQEGNRGRTRFFPGGILELARSSHRDHFRCSHRFYLCAPIAANRGRSIPCRRNSSPVTSARSWPIISPTWHPRINTLLNHGSIPSLILQLPVLRSLG